MVDSNPIKVEVFDKLRESTEHFDRKKLISISPKSKQHNERYLPEYSFHHLTINPSLARGRLSADQKKKNLPY